MADGTELPADLVVYATGYGSMNGWAADLISQEVADKVGKVWGLGSGHHQGPGPVGGRAAQHVEADAAGGAVVPRRQPAPVAPLLAATSRCSSRRASRASTRRSTACRRSTTSADGSSPLDELVGEAGGDRVDGVVEGVDRDLLAAPEHDGGATSSAGSITCALPHTAAPCAAVAAAATARPRRAARARRPSRCRSPSARGREARLVRRRRRTRLMPSTFAVASAGAVLARAAAQPRPRACSTRSSRRCRRRRRRGPCRCVLGQRVERRHASHLLGRRGPVRLAHAPSRSSRWSPTRSALAIAVSAGFTALDDGKKLVSTT